MIRLHAADNLTDWFQAGQRSDSPDLQPFAAALQPDEPSIRLALVSQWRTGPLEGHVNRLKRIKPSL